MNNRGITLIELLVVVTVLGILAFALGFGFLGWQAKYSIESQVKELSNDLMNARLRAMQRNREHFVVLEATQYTVYEDTDPAPDGDGTRTGSDAKILQQLVDQEKPITWSGDNDIDFTKRGLSEDNKTICVKSGADPDYDCIVISATRINMGKIDNQGGACDSANCTAK